MSRLLEAAELRQRAAESRAAVFDIDGVMTDGRLHYDAAGNAAQSFHAHDGWGLKALIRQGLTVIALSARRTAAAKARLDDLGIVHYRFGVEDKLAALEQILKMLEVPLAAVCYSGDDWNDVPVLRVAGLACAPASAQPCARALAHYVTTLPAGFGAVREICELLLEAHGGYSPLTVDDR